jgi:glucosamine--fructose-6-phosphate aminotransferase (isomerizing)
MCGIFGIVTKTERPLGRLMIEVGHRLSYRGYDSVGCATIHTNHTIDLRKDVGMVDEVAKRLGFEEMLGNRGILQLRWATFGTPSYENAQPHLDSDGDLIGAHNGNVVNHNDLRQQFINDGMIVRSNNDGETCVHAVEKYVNLGDKIVNAIRAAYQDLAGDYSFVIGKIEDDCLYAIKKGSGLVIGIGDEFTCVSSDLPSILDLTRRIIRVEDGEIVTLFADHVEICKVSDGSRIERDIEIVKESMDVVRKNGYAHFMLKEIYEQPSVASDLLNYLDNSIDLEVFLELLANARNLYLVGCGTSYHACILGSVYLSQIAGRLAIPILAPQFIPQYGSTLNSDDIGIFVSQSGETKDVLNALGYAQNRGVNILSLVNVIGSSLTRSSNKYLSLVCGYEISVPATKTYTNQVVTFLYLAMRLNGNSTSTLKSIPELMAHTLEVTDTQVDMAITHLAKWKNLYCLGYGLTYPIALEAALKIKEVTYTHCEGMLSTEFKHGSLSAVTNEFPVIFIAGPQDIPLMISGINETTCRGGYALVVGPNDARLESQANQMITLPDADPFTTALLAILPLQKLAYKLCLAFGYNPDFPRNLSKTLTVD